MAGLAERVYQYLLAAQNVIQSDFGQASLQRLGANRVNELDNRTREALRQPIDEGIASIPEDQPIESLPEDQRTRLAQVLGEITTGEILRGLFLSVGDRLWVDYLTQMEALRTSIGLEAYGQRDPLVQYKSRAFDMFGTLLSSIRSGVVARMFRTRPAAASTASRPAQPSIPQLPTDEPEDASADAPKKSKKRRRKRR